MAAERPPRNVTVSFVGEATPLVDVGSSQTFPVLLHRDSEFTVGSEYTDNEVHNDLTTIRGATLITAE